jgi:hypothetical protein
MRTGRVALTAILTLAAGYTPKFDSSSKPTSLACTTPALSAAAFAPHNLGLADPAVIGMSARDLEARLSLIDESHAKGLRVDLFWRTIEPSPGVFDWSKFDPIIDAANAHCLPILAVLDYAPLWAALPGCDDITVRCAPADARAFAEFARAAVTRYAARGVHAFELWNEQNITNRWSPTPNVANYTTLVRQTCPIIKRVDPQATVVVGGLAQGTGSQDIPMSTFAEQFLGGNPGSCWDALALHLYDTGAFGQAGRIHLVMAHFGFGNKSIWATEAGRPTLAPCGSGNATEVAQDKMLRDFVNRWRLLPWVGPLFWFITKDVPPSNTFGLVCANGTHKLAFARFQTLAE